MVTRKQFIYSGAAMLAAPLGLAACAPPDSFALHVTVLGIRNAMLNQTVEVPLMRQKLTNFLRLKSDRPDLVVRFGRGETLRQSLRRNIQTVLI